MLDTYNAIKNKERILSIIRLRGPSLPVQIARELGISSIFASAFLSELKAEGKIAISDMKVGSSPLYYLPEQELQLENFIQYLNQREKEAFELLKKEKILEDEKQEPVIRVALRAIKDFAIDRMFKINGDSKLFWKFFSIPDSYFIELVKGKVYGERKAEEALVSRAIVSQITTREKEEIEKIVVPLKEKAEEQAILIANSARVAQKKEKRKKKKPQESEFNKKVKDYLTAKDIEVRETISEKKREVECIIRIDIAFGKQEFYLVAKDKKSISENDLTVALQKAQSKKMPALLMSNGSLNKKAKAHLKDWNNLVKFEELKF